MSFSSLLKSTQSMLKKHSPEILTGIGIAGMVTTVILAVKATPKAMILIEHAGYEKGSNEDPCMDMEYTSLTKIEMVKVAWKPYVPAVITGVCSIACIIGASSVNVRRNAALATAYTISETALKEYKDKVLETIGEKKEKNVRDSIAQDKVDRDPVLKKEIIVTKTGDTLCYDAMSGRYFKSDMETLKRVENELNRRLLEDGFVCLNDLYDLIGGDMDPIRIGDDLGWDSRTGLINLSFSSILASDGTPCLVVDFSVAPTYEFYH